MVLIKREEATIILTNLETGNEYWITDDPLPACNNELVERCFGVSQYRETQGDLKAAVEWMELALNLDQQFKEKKS